MAVLVSMLSIAVGQTRMYLSGGGTDRAILRPKDATGRRVELQSFAWCDQLDLECNRVLREGPDGAPLADAEFQMGVMPPLGTFDHILQVRGSRPNRDKNS
ncbi:MAG: hypothetical protein WDM77_10670 [Steroidobacteraceae bacterium]